MAYDILPLNRLIQQFAKLPGIGKKTAGRLAFSILTQPEDVAKEFADALLEARQKIHLCPVCQCLTELDVCPVCSEESRNRSVICVVEDSKDVMAIERTHEYRGLYHVLHGVLSPLDSIGPEQLKIKELLTRLADPEVKEVILATNPTVEGEATAGYLARLIKPMGLKVSRLAFGIPIGGDLEYADEVTLSRALEGRNEIKG